MFELRNSLVLILGRTDIFVDCGGKDKMARQFCYKVINIAGVGQSSLGGCGGCFLILANFSTRNARISASESMSSFSEMLVEMMFNRESESLNAVTMVGSGRQQMRTRSVGLRGYKVSDMTLRTNC